MTESNNKSKHSSTVAALGCLSFPILFISLTLISTFVMSALTEKIYKPGEAPDSVFSVLLHIPGYNLVNNNEVTTWRWSTDEKDYLDERHPGWSIYEPATSDSIKTDEFSFIRWTVEEVSTKRKRIDLEWGDDDGSLFSTYELENNQITPISSKIGINPGYAIASGFLAFFISIILCLLLAELCMKTLRKKSPQRQQLTNNF